MLTWTYRDQKKDLESKVTSVGKASWRMHDGPARSPCRAVVECMALASLAPCSERLAQKESIASLSVAEGRITAVTFSASGR